MISDPQSHVEATDRNAAISLAAGILAVVAVCVAVVPVPFTGYVCFPLAGILAVIALVNGVRALRRFDALGTSGRGMAVVGLAASALALLSAACSAAILVILGVRVLGALSRLVH